MASFHYFGEDELWLGCINQHLEIIFGDGNLFSSRHWRLHSNYENETLGYSKQTCQGEVITDGTLGMLFTDSALEYTVVSVLLL